MSKHIVFIHGFLGSSLNWSRVINLLRTKLNNKLLSFSSVDLLGHARGNKIDDPVSLDGASFSKLLLDDFRKQLPAGSFVPVAHSFGLRPLLEFLRTESQRCPEIIVEDSLPGLSEPGYRMLKKVLTETPRTFNSRLSAKAFFDTNYGEGSLSRFFLSNIGHKSDSTLGWRFDADFLLKLLEEAKNNPLWDEWQSYPGLINLIVGDHSDVVDYDRLNKAKLLRSDSRPLVVNVIKQSGHWVHSDQLESFVDCVARIINKSD